MTDEEALEQARTEIADLKMQMALQGVPSQNSLVLKAAGVKMEFYSIYAGYFRKQVTHWSLHGMYDGRVDSIYDGLIDTLLTVQHLLSPLNKVRARLADAWGPSLVGMSIGQQDLIRWASIAAVRGIEFALPSELIPNAWPTCMQALAELRDGGNHVVQLWLQEDNDGYDD